MSTSVQPSRIPIEQAAMQFPMQDVLLRYAREQKLSMEAAKEHERELKRYLILCSINPTAKYGMKGPIDNLWHTFLLFTEKYANFCSEVAGRFIHHVPASFRASTDSDYQLFLRDYEKQFKEIAPVHLWPRITSESGGQQQSADCSFGNCGPSCSPSCGAAGCGNSSE